MAVRALFPLHRSLGAKGCYVEPPLSLTRTLFYKMSVTYDEKKRAHAQLLGFAPKISTLGNKTPSPDFPYSLWIFKMTFLNHEKLFDRQRKFHSGPRTAFLGGRKRKHSERALEQQARPGKEHHPATRKPPSLLRHSVVQRSV